VTLTVLLVAGARPNFMKVAPILAALRAAGHAGVLVHTGQHYDDQMSDAFFRDLGLSPPDHYLGVGSGTHAQQTARVMMGFEPVLVSIRPHWVIVVGDVNSTLACALTTAKLKRELGCRLAHVEAGLRSGDWGMPEEVNRVLTDRVSDLLFTPSHDALPNLLAEGISPERVVFVGNVMIDAVFSHLAAAQALAVPARLGLAREGYVLATLHRPSNVDQPVTLRVVLEALVEVSDRLPVVLPLHPRTRANIEAFRLDDLARPLRTCPPLGYTEMLSLSEAAAVVLTDSGGLQEETTALGVPCVTLRQVTERPVTVERGTNRMAPWPLTVSGVVRSFEAALASGRPGVGARCPEGWDGHAAERVVEALVASPLGARREGVAG
jgi:UDP-N-acetylglucosamine 2-epimerase (non-hydrolysing)